MNFEAAKRGFRAEAHEMPHGGGWIVRVAAPPDAAPDAALLAPSAVEARRLFRALAFGLAAAADVRLGKVRLKWHCETPRGRAEVEALGADLAAKHG